MCFRKPRVQNFETTGTSRNPIHICIDWFMTNVFRQQKFGGTHKAICKRACFRTFKHHRRRHLWVIWAQTTTKMEGKKKNNVAHQSKNGETFQAASSLRGWWFQKISGNVCLVSSFCWNKIHQSQTTPQNPANWGNGSPNPNPSAFKKQMGQTTCSTAPSRALQRKKQQMWWWLPCCWGREAFH